MPRRLRLLVAALLLIVVGVIFVGYPDDPLGLRCRIAPTADLTAHPSTYQWIDITRDLQLGKPITHTRGSEDEQAESNSESGFSLKNPVGRYTTDNPMSDLWPGFGLNTPVEFATNAGDGSGWDVEWVQYIGEVVDDWPAGSPHKCEANVTCNGLFRRMGQNDEKPRSALQRFISRSSPLAWWPLESGDDREATSSPSGIAGGTPMIAELAGGVLGHRVSGVVGGSTTGPLGAAAAVDLSGGGQLRGQIPVTSATAPFRFEMGSLIKEAVPVLGSTLLYQIQFGSSIVTVMATEEAGEETFILFEGADTFHSNQATTVLDDAVWHHVRLDLSTPDAGASTAYVLAVDGVQILSGTATGLDYGYPTEVVVAPSGELDAASHPVFWSGTLPAANAGYNAFTAYTKEKAHERLERLCDEENLPSDITATTSTVMGPQPTMTTLELFRDCEATDHGQLDDSQGTVGYRALSEMWNQDPVLVIDAAYRNELFMPFTPTTDDQKRMNTVTAKRPGGGEVTVSNTDDINGVPGVRKGVGVYKGDVEPNVPADDVLVYHAGLFANLLGSYPGKRYPSITADFLRAPHLLKAFRSMRLGDRVLIKNPPRQHARGDIDLIFTGWGRSILGRRKSNLMIANCAPYVHDVGVAGDVSTGGAWLQTSAGTQLAAELVPGATTLSVTVDGPLFSTNAAHLVSSPLKLIFGGEVAPVVSIASAVRDSFARTVSNGWGTADSGQAWTTSGGAASDYSVSSGTGRISNGDVNNLRHVLLDIVHGDFEAGIDCVMPIGSATGASYTRWLLARVTDTSNYYAARLVLNTSGVVFIEIQKRVAGSLSSVTSLVSAGANAAGNVWRLTFRGTGSTLMATTRNVTTGGATTTVSGTDTSISSGTKIGVIDRLETGNTNTLPVVGQWDNLEVFNPQTIVVERQLPKRHPAGTLVRVHRPLFAVL